jgi:NADH dehydrogenase (ubiquinone) 1 alpha subcomplex subunit 2
MSTKYAFTQGLKEVRFHLCHQSSASEATRYGMRRWLRASLPGDASADNMVRSFLKRAYPTMKKNNPNTPILIREATGTSPKVWARYGYGKEKSETLEGMLQSISGEPRLLTLNRSVRQGDRRQGHRTSEGRVISRGQSVPYHDPPARRATGSSVHMLIEHPRLKLQPPKSPLPRTDIAPS